MGGAGRVFYYFLIHSKRLKNLEQAFCIGLGKRMQCSELISHPAFVAVISWNEKKYNDVLQRL